MPTTGTDLDYPLYVIASLLIVTCFVGFLEIWMKWKEERRKDGNRS